MGKIKALDPAVVHKIAAGEIIVSPANALKELLENSLDAGATNIEVVVKNGGHKLLQVTDNGQGIDQSDLEILCQRFTTSKISKFQDLKSINTLGFRGEALASISHISHLSVRTKTKESRTARLATYQDGKLTSDKPSAGVQGTQIIVEDLFYNTPLRSQALQGDASNSNEYQKILDVISRYSIEYPGTFSCKRYQDSQPVVINGKTQLDKLRKVFGTGTAQSLLKYELEAAPEFGLSEVTGWVSDLNYTTKRPIPFIFFINKRLVTCEPLSRAIRKTYQDYLPKAGSAFVFLSLGLRHDNIDINVHPTKREVFFLHDDEIIQLICSKLRLFLDKTENQRDFAVQSYISTSVADSLVADSRVTRREPEIVTKVSKPRYEYNLVRTDPHQPKLTHFASSLSPKKRPPPPQSFEEPDASTELNTPLSPVKAMAEQSPEKELKDLGLISVQELVDEVKQKSHLNLLYTFSEHTYVGMVDRNRSLAAIQVDVKLYLVEYTKVFHQLFYQLSLMQLGNFGTVHLGDGLLITELLSLGVDKTAVDFYKLVEMKPMLEDYFQIGLRQKNDQWFLVKLPVILPQYTFTVSKIPEFISKLVTEVNWDDEKSCIHDVACALSDLHVPTSSCKPEKIQLLFEAAKASLVPSRDLLPCVVEIANLPGLYRVFERC